MPQQTSHPTLLPPNTPPPFTLPGALDPSPPPPFFFDEPSHYFTTFRFLQTLARAT